MDEEAVTLYLNEETLWPIVIIKKVITAHDSNQRVNSGFVTLQVWHLQSAMEYCESGRLSWTGGVSEVI